MYITRNVASQKVTTNQELVLERFHDRIKSSIFSLLDPQITIYRTAMYELPVRAMEMRNIRATIVRVNVQ